VLQIGIEDARGWPTQTMAREAVGEGVLARCRAGQPCLTADAPQGLRCSAAVLHVRRASHWSRTTSGSPDGLPAGTRFLEFRKLAHLPPAPEGNGCADLMLPVVAHTQTAAGTPQGEPQIVYGSKISVRSAFHWRSVSISLMPMRCEKPATSAKTTAARCLVICESLLTAILIRRT
jgi:hypothetical protein